MSKSRHWFFSFSILAVCLALTGPAIATTGFTARTALTTIPNADPFALSVASVAEGGELNLRLEPSDLPATASITLEDYIDLIMTNGTVRVWTEGGEIKAEAVDIYKRSSIQGSGGSELTPSQMSDLQTWVDTYSNESDFLISLYLSS